MGREYDAATILRRALSGEDRVIACLEPIIEQLDDLTEIAAVLPDRLAAVEERLEAIELGPE